MPFEEVHHPCIGGWHFHGAIEFLRVVHQFREPALPMRTG
jgi:hypothetical protein